VPSSTKKGEQKGNLGILETRKIGKRGLQEKTDKVNGGGNNWVVEDGKEPGKSGTCNSI